MRKSIPTFLAATLLCLATAPTTLAADVDALIASLANQDAAVRVEALDELARHGKTAAPAVPALIKVLAEKDKDLCWQVARTLGAIGPGAADAVPGLTACLASDDEKARAYAAHALGKIGKASMPAVPTLANAVADSSPLVRRAAVSALRAIDPPPEVSMPVMIKVLENANSAAVMAAVQSLAEEGKDAVPRLIEALGNEKSCYWACLIAEEIGPDAAPAVPALIKVLDCDEPESRLQALLALGKIGPEAKSAVPAIGKVLGADVHEGVRYAAAYALGSIGDKSASDALTGALEHKDMFLRMLSAWALAAIHPDDKAAHERAADLLVEGLSSESRDVRAAAIRGLIDLDVAPEKTAPAVLAMIEKADPDELAHTMGVMASHGAKVVPRLSEALQKEPLRMHAARVLYLIGADAKGAVPALVEALAVDDPAFVREVEFVLAKLGEDAAPATKALIKNLSSEDDEVRYAACYALGRIGPKARAAARPLALATKSEDDFMRVASAWALVRILPDHDKVMAVAVPLLTGVLDSDREYAKIEAATTLGNIGERAKSAVPQLKKLLDDANEDVRKAATEAIKKIEG